MNFDVGRLIAYLELQGAKAFERDLSTADRKTAEFGRTIDKAGDKTDRYDDSLNRANKRAEQFGDTNVQMSQRLERAHTVVGTALAATGAAILSLSALAVARFAVFDKAMSEVLATTGAAPQVMRDLSNAAVDAGAKTIYTASEAANAETELAKAGVKVADILGGGLSGSLSLAAAGQLDVAEAAQIASIAMTQFNLQGKDVPHIADLLAAGAGKAQGSVQDLAFAFKQSGLVASQMGLSVDDTTGTLAAFANAGLIGSDAGTSFRTMLLSLAGPSNKASQLLHDYNIEAYDAHGNFIGITALAGKLHDQLGPLAAKERDYALATIFGNDAVRAANVLVREGSSGLTGWTDKVNDAGYAARFAATMQDNLAGDVEKLGGAFDSALIQTGSGANEVLRDMVQFVTSLLDAYGDLPPEVQKGVLQFGFAAGAATLLAGGLLLVIPRIVETRSAILTLTKAYPGFVTAMRGAASFLSGPWGIALAVAAVGVITLQHYLESLQASSDEIASSLIGAKNAADLFATAAKGKDITTWRDVKADLQDLDNVLEAAADQSSNLFARFDSSHFGAIETLRQIGTQLGELADSDLPSAQAAFRLMAAETDGSDKKLWQLLSTTSDYRQALIEQLTATGEYNENMTEGQKKQVLLNAAIGNAAEVTDYVAGAYAGASVEAEGLTLSIDELVDALNEANGVQISAQEAAIRYADLLATVAAAADKTNAGISLNTDAGRKNRGMLLDLATAAQKAAEANLNAGGSVDDYAASMQAGHDQLVAQAIAFGATADEAAALADSVFKIPSKKELEIIANTTEAMNSINRFVTNVNGKRINLLVTANGRPVNAGMYAAGGYRAGATYHANGSFSEQQISQMGTAGQTRVWNEENPYAEAFVSTNPAYRDRSRSIMRTVAPRVGMRAVDENEAGAALVVQGARGPQRIEGELTLTNGRAFISGVVTDVLDGQADSLSIGRSAP